MILIFISQVPAEMIKKIIVQGTSILNDVALFCIKVV